MAVPAGSPERGLRGRHAECLVLEQLMTDVRSGRSAVLVLRGPAGVGKTALLHHLLEAASDCRVVRVTGVESEMELAYASLQQLCVSMLDRLDHLPAPQRNALQAATGVREGQAPDRFLIGLAVLSLLAEVAEERPLVCLVDDAQWLDQASLHTLAFVARRLLAERIAMVFAVREPSTDTTLVGLPHLVVPGLADHDAREVLDMALPGRMDEQVRDRIVAEAHGNPLALLELTRGRAPEELAGGFGLPDAPSLANRIEQGFHRRLRSLPPDTQRILLLAAAEPVGDLALLWRAAESLGIGPDAVVAAEADGLLEVHARVRFRHPLVRSAVYRAASPADRRAAHRALAAATDQVNEPDRRAWHGAHAAYGPDEVLAEELERSANRAEARGGLAAAAAFLERATQLTPDPARRAARALAAAHAKFEAGAPGSAEELLATAEIGPLDDLGRAGLERLRGRLAFSLRRGRDAPPLLLNAANRLAELDPRLARETYLEALGAAIFTGRLSDGWGTDRVAEAASSAPPAPQPARAADLLLDGLTIRFMAGYAAGVPPLRSALEAFRRQESPNRKELDWLWLACRVAVDLWDDDSWRELTTGQVQAAREIGALGILPLAATYRAGVHVHAGEFAAAEELITEADALVEATGSSPLMYTSLVLAAWRGRERQVMGLIEAGIDDATNRGEGRTLGLAGYATAVLYNGLGRYPNAFAAAQEACSYDDLGLVGWSLIELIEAAARTGRHEVAVAALGKLCEQTRACGTDWALGVEAGSRALVTSDGGVADALYRESIVRLTRTRVPVYLARSRLNYGEWLRRENRRLDAREQLRPAHDMFSRMGADAFAERARREILATGEVVRKRDAGPIDALTAQESQIARLARDGYSNPAIGAQLFISPRTVEWHLGNVFSKLGIRSRRGLPDALLEREGTPPRPARLT